MSLLFDSACIPYTLKDDAILTLRVFTALNVALGVLAEKYNYNQDDWNVYLDTGCSRVNSKKYGFNGMSDFNFGAQLDLHFGPPVGFLMLGIRCRAGISSRIARNPNI